MHYSALVLGRHTDPSVGKMHGVAAMYSSYNFFLLAGQLPSMRFSVIPATITKHAVLTPVPTSIHEWPQRTAKSCKVRTMQYEYTHITETHDRDGNTAVSVTTSTAAPYSHRSTSFCGDKEGLLERCYNSLVYSSTHKGPS